MGKKFFIILVAIMLCLGLAACGHHEEPEPINDVDDYSFEDSGIQYYEGVEPDGDYEHSIEGCTFYTKNNLHDWIDDENFDFYGMMDHFGWTERLEGMTDAEGCVAYIGPNVGISDGMVSLNCDSTEGYYHYIIFDYAGGREIFIEEKDCQSAMMYTADGMKVSYEMCELLLYAMERIEDNPDTADIYMVDLDLPDRIVVTID